MPPPRLQQELDKLDGSIAFRSSATHAHHTWARTFHAYPELYIRPSSLAEIQQLVTLARRCRRRLLVVGSGHSPSDLTCTSSWMVNLDHYSDIVSVVREHKRVVVQAGIRLKDLNSRCAQEYGLVMANLGSVDDQSIAGAIATGTHGSSLRHGLLSQPVKSLGLVLANGRLVRCSASQNPELFRAALVSLGALGIVVEVEYELTEVTNIAWEQSLETLSYILENWNKDLWTQQEYTRVWWLPYTRRAIIWKAKRTTEPTRIAHSSWYGGALGFHTYHILLYISSFFPPILPAVEWFVFGMQYGFHPGTVTSGVEPLQQGLLMDCLYSQFVNEWAIPLSKGPEAINRLSAWINGDQKKSGIPFSNHNLYVHSPVEVRVADTSTTIPRPYLDPSVHDGPTLYLNATLYRAYTRDPPCHARYYEAFEWLMKDLGGRPHWAKNFAHVTQPEISSMYGDALSQWLKVRQDVDPDGMFAGHWHRRMVLPETTELPLLPLEEQEVATRNATQGGLIWYGDKGERGIDAPLHVDTKASDGRSWWFGGSGSGELEKPLRSSSSEESFDVLHGAEASVLLHDDDHEDGVSMRARDAASGGYTG